jgi:hypothetical protein
MKRMLAIAIAIAAVLASGLGGVIGHWAGADAAPSWNATTETTLMRATDDSRDRDDEAPRVRLDDVDVVHRGDAPMRTRDRFEVEPALAARNPPGSAVAARDTAMH